jgi:REP element-mobilizing transposase RayT
MGRRYRPNLPGAPFHITARIQNRDALFSGLESGVDRLIRSSVEDDGMRLLAYAVMSNHIHLLVVQDNRPLGMLLQPLLRRISLLVMRRKNHEGHVFGRRFADSACLNAAYLRDCITYIHLNPVRAGVSSGPADYPWSSHRWYCDPIDARRGRRMPPFIDSGLRLFARAAISSRAACSRDYLEYVSWRNRMDACILSGGALPSRAAPQAPRTPGGDAHWARTFAVQLNPAEQSKPARADLLHLARVVLADAVPPADMDLLRSGGRSRALVQLRRGLIVRATLAGYSRRQIARFLRISCSAVSLAAPRDLRQPPR